MGRVQNVRSRPNAVAPGVQRHKAQTNAKKPEYKVVLEEITERKKALVTLQCPTKDPPRGYTFVAAGHPQLTLACKEMARRDSKSIYVVSTTKHMDTALSTQVHRVGYHFPSEIVSRACTSLGISLSEQGTILSQHLMWPEEVNVKQKIAQSKPITRSTKKNAKRPTQDEIDLEAGKGIDDLFPAIPREDRRAILKHSFDINHNRVGSLVDELPMPRRVQLAAVAHIRHTYTNYDKLLKQVPYQKAREMVEEGTLAKLAEWRGDQDDDVETMEDILREVVVIDDDDDDGEHSQLEPINISSDTREESVDTLLDYNVKRIQQQQDITEYAAEPYRGMSIDSDERQEATALGNGQFIYDQRRNERAGARRNQVWERAKNRVRRPDYQYERIYVTDADPTSRKNMSEQRQHNPIVLLAEAPRVSRPDCRANDLAYRAPAPEFHSTIDTQQLRYPSHMIEQEPRHTERRKAEVVPRIYTSAAERDEVILPSIEPATPTAGRFEARPRSDSEVIVLDSPTQNNKRRRLDRLEENRDHRLAAHSGQITNYQPSLQAVNPQKYGVIDASAPSKSYQDSHLVGVGARQHAGIARAPISSFREGYFTPIHLNDESSRIGPTSHRSQVLESYGDDRRGTNHLPQPRSDSRVVYVAPSATLHQDIHREEVPRRHMVVPGHARNEGYSFRSGEPIHGAAKPASTISHGGLRSQPMAQCEPQRRYENRQDSRQLPLQPVVHKPELFLHADQQESTRANGEQTARIYVAQPPETRRLADRQQQYAGDNRTRQDYGNTVIRHVDRHNPSPNHAAYISQASAHSVATVPAHGPDYADVVRGENGRLYDRRTGREVYAIDARATNR